MKQIGVDFLQESILEIPNVRKVGEGTVVEVDSWAAWIWL